MKVAFISRSTLFTVRGGDTTQVEQTAAGLRKLGVEVEIRRASEHFNPDSYDLLHFFNLIRPADILSHVQKTHRPVVVSPIYVDYSSYDRQSRQGLAGTIARTLDKNQVEYLKTIWRTALGQDKLVSAAYLLGHRQAMQKVVERASLLLPNSESEAQRVKTDLGRIFSYRVVPNGVDESRFYPDPAVERHRDRVICVGQVEGRKNQHRLIEATRGMDVELVIIGKPSPNNRGYLDHCRSIAHDRVRFIDFLPQEALREWYASSAVHALPSWFETTGLSSLEAAACGCRLVVSEAGDTRDYFEGYASFCKPDSATSIREALSEALARKEEPDMGAKILREYTWTAAAHKTLKAYEEVLP